MPWCMSPSIIYCTCANFSTTYIYLVVQPIVGYGSKCKVPRIKGYTCNNDAYKTGKVVMYTQTPDGPDFEN